MKNLLTFLAFVSIALCAFSQLEPQPETADVNMHFSKRQTPYTPYELYPWALSSAPNLLSIYREKYEARRLDPSDKTAEESYRSKLRITMRPLIEKRDAFLNYSKQDKTLSAEQGKIVEEIRKISFPILKQKKIEELTSEELIQSINDESSTIAPLVKKFLDQMEGEKSRSSHE